LKLFSFTAWNISIHASLPIFGGTGI
jgi:hypothetical protein